MQKDKKMKHFIRSACCLFKVVHNPDYFVVWKFTNLFLKMYLGRVMTFTETIDEL